MLLTDSGWNPPNEVLHSTPATTRISAARTPPPIAGVLLFLMILCSVGGEIIIDLAPDLHHVVYIAAGIFAWLAAVLLFPYLRRVQKIQICLFLLIGAGLVAYGFSQGVSSSVPHTLARNTSLVSMILSVGFLKLVLLGNLDQDAALPAGRRAYLHTLVAISVFGSIINISAPIIIGDRLVAKQPMSMFTARSITRVFCACAAWSPFFAGMAVVLTYVTDVRLVYVMLGGLPFMVLSTLLVYGKGIYSHPQLVDSFQGYPVQPASLLVPLLLAVAVLLAGALYPELSILTVIAVSALLLTGALLLRQHGAGAAGLFVGHVKNGLPLSVNEVLLFLAAGVLASGLVALMSSANVQLPISTYTVPVAAALLAMMIVIAAMGLHPVIQISVLTPLVLITNPQPELLALTFLFSWSLGTMASPLSGTQLVFQGRYGIPAWRGALQNWSYVAVMYVIAVILLQLFATFVPRVSS